MKRSKNDHIRSSISRYFKRRQFHESEMPSRKDVPRDQAVSELSIRRRAQSRTSVDNGLALSSISGDTTACDQQYARLKAHVSGAVSPYKEELQALLFPMFTHVYLEMLCNGHKVPAHKFYERYSEGVSTEQNRAFIKLLKKMETKAEIMSCKEVMFFRENRRSITLDSASLNYLMRILKSEDSMILLQLFNQFIHVNVRESGGAACESHIKLNSLPVDPEYDDQAEASSSAQAADQSEASLLEELSAAIKAVRELPPSLPSICFFTFLNTYQGLCSSTISGDKKRLSGSFEDASISLWNLEADAMKPEPADCDVSRVTLGVDFLHSTPDDIKERMSARSNKNSEILKLVGHRGPVYKTCFLSDSSTHLLSCSEDSSVRLWNLPSQTCSALYQGHASPVWDISVSSTDVWFASCSHDMTAKLWTFDRSYPLRSFVGHAFDVDCLEFHPNNNYLATGSGDKTVRFWNVAEGRTVRLFQGHRGSILALTFSPDGKLLASAGEDRRIRVWDLGSGHLVKELRGHSDTVYSLAFNEQSTLLASGGADCFLRLWDISKTAEPHQSEGHSSPELLGAFPTKSALISYLQFSPFNILLAAGASS